MTKSTICTAVILSLAFTANSFAVPTIFLDADTPATGSNLGTTPLVTPYGTIIFVGEFKYGSSDPEFTTAGASGNTFNILEPGDLSAELRFDFDVISLEFIYGGNIGDIKIEARNKDDVVVDDFYQASTYAGQPAGPITLSGSGIRSLYWTDTQSSIGYAALDNITVSIIPSPGAVVLAGIGVSLVGWLRRRRMV